MLKRDAMLKHLRTSTPVIAPSMLKCDFGNLHLEVEHLDRAGFPVLHLDVMDGHFVPNLSYGPMVIRSLRQLTDTPFDAHLMISDPTRYVSEYLDAGCEAVTFHVEAVPEPSDLLDEIRASDAVAGLAINPATPMEAVEPWLDHCDLLLVMSVRPGFGGQAFMPEVLPKVRRARELAGDRLIISMDGGVAAGTIGACSAAGTDLFVAGSSVFDEPDYAAAGKQLATLARNAQRLAEESA
jgi:ribulose-phosphate 3-epimerase